MNYQNIGNGTFVLGNCLEVMKEIPDGSIDMILCDLPYGTTTCSWDSIIPFEALWEQYERIIKENGAIVLTASQPFASALAMSNIKLFKYEWIWVKDRKTLPMQAKKRPMGGHENVLVFYKALPTYNPIFRKRDKSISAKTPKSNSEVYNSMQGQKDEYVRRTDTITPDTVITFATERGLHPTQKPVALFEYLIKTYTKEGDLVLDNCAGSGTTAIAAENCNRRWACIEQLEEYADKAVERIRKYLENKPGS